MLSKFYITSCRFSKVVDFQARWIGWCKIRYYDQMSLWFIRRFVWALSPKGRIVLLPIPSYSQLAIYFPPNIKSNIGLKCSWILRVYPVFLTFETHLKVEVDKGSFHGILKCIRKARSVDVMDSVLRCVWMEYACCSSGKLILPGNRPYLRYNTW